MREQGEGDDKAFLIVEDNPVTLRAYARFFGRYAPIITAVSAREACAALQENRARIRGCVIDWRLEAGEPDGLFVARYARDLVDRPILLTTGHESAEPREGASRLGVWFAAKPLDRDVVQDFIEACEPARRRERILQRRLELARELAAQCELRPSYRRVLEAAVRNGGDAARAYDEIRRERAAEGRAYSRRVFNNAVSLMRQQVQANRRDVEAQNLLELVMWIVQRADG